VDGHQGRVVVITGAASGMGAATAALFAAGGARVVIVDRDGDGASRVAARLNGPEPLVGDITDSAFCEHAITTISDRHGRVDVLVNAAGTILRADALATSDADWHQLMRVNVDGTFFMCRAVIRPMRTRGGGAIVNFGSIWGGVGGAGHVAYCASKGAVHNLTRALALDHARDGIRINAVCPGEVDTPMLRSGGRSQPLTDDDLRRIAHDGVPTGRVAEPDEIARVVVFLASDQASYMTGALVAVDGGYTAR
jgi:meso-butanediol dehydrogenase / (S,S)-butanediol dehydrogenase / diacetyl reductase